MSEKVSNIFTKVLACIIDVIFIVFVLCFSKLNIISKIITIFVVSIFNIYLMPRIIKKINVEIEKTKLEELQYLGPSPKFEIIYNIAFLITIYCMTIYYMLGYYNNKISFFSPLGIYILIFVVMIIIDSLYGPQLQVNKFKNNTTFIMEKSDRTGVSILGSRVGSYKDGIVLGDYVFSKEHILYAKEVKEDFTITLTDNREIVIREKMAKKYFRNVLIIDK
ncbi:hypothetical protein [Haloimpatiens lingqiaonensis]|uniref:hypothetical protein n=1 Tax=Haloimpatiens lingqiaonensis TaxID=1380675 RepID=UPI0010FDFF14|nr:hypothetical protein [Haloimpatiens lingqiaonensis]